MEKEKVLIIATVSGFAAQFEMNNIHILQSLGYEVHYAANFYNPHYGKDNQRLEGTGIICHQVDFARSPFCIKENGKAYRQLKKLMKECTFGIIHCHTPVGGALGRIVGRKYRKDGTKVLYTAHGFHFFQGAPLWNWLLYFPIEWLLAKDTDVLITINEEDYRRAKKYLAAKNRSIEKVQGVGIDIEEYQTLNSFSGKKIDTNQVKIKENTTNEKQQEILRELLPYQKLSFAKLCSEVFQVPEAEINILQATKLYCLMTNIDFLNCDRKTRNIIARQVQTLILPENEKKPLEKRNSIGLQKKLDSTWNVIYKGEKSDTKKII